ncbi:hypothetical protein SBV1_2200028 [Verrucomicrobia bacterium]|nr:hypothetical protein SBV1_2200028 [Verrucomicrobiota bacterium]
MDGHRNADANIESVGDRHPPQPLLFRKELEDRDGHCKRNGRVRRGPTPEDPAAQEAESENTAQIRANDVRGMGPAGNRFVCGSDEAPDEFGLTDSPADQAGSGASDDAAQRKQEERQHDGQESADTDSRKHPRTKEWIAGREEIAPIEA